MIVLNGLIAMVPTGDECDETLGVMTSMPIKTFSGTVIEPEPTGFPFSKGMADKVGWGHKYANVSFYTNQAPINPAKVKEEFIQQFFGSIKTAYHHAYSDLTGYLWTEEEWTVGGHDLLEILAAHKGEYIHMEIELFDKKPKGK